MKNLIAVALLGIYGSVVLAQDEPKDPKHKVMGLFDDAMDKIDFSLKRDKENKHYHFSLGYSVFVFSNLAEVSRTHWGFSPAGPVMTAQAIFGEKTLFTPKLGYRMLFDVVNFELDAGLNTDFTKTSYSISPAIGFSIWDIIGIYYQYDFQLGKQQFTDIGKHRFGVFVSPKFIFGVLKN